MKPQTLRHKFRLWTILLVVVPSLLIITVYTVGEIGSGHQQKLELISWTLIGGTLLIVLLILPLATRLSNQIEQPIACLIEQSNSVAAGTYDKVGPGKCVERMPYELANLFKTFVKMSREIENTVELLKENEAKLGRKVIEIQEINTILTKEMKERQAAQEALQQLNAELESKVLYRTRQLQEINAALQKEIIERQTTQEELEKLSITDVLTGLNNHRYIIEFLGKKMAESDRYNTPLSIGMFDLDNFKKVNDNYGHVEGDNVLHDVAECLKNNIRNTDVLGRYGGEEFLLVFPYTSIEQAYDLTERIRILVSELLIGNREIKITISGGLAEYNGESLTNFIRQADQNLYHAKESGRNRVVKNKLIDA
ncbi:MAG: diguanylate cyclase/phosphodiesterase [Anaerosporomusa subterranea]|nr:diguanylate cyclase/phosphodiesterase [Anaerosporomusa subterranea]